MSSRSYGVGAQKADRALELHEKGITPSIIAERLGVRPCHIQGMLQRARQRREKAAAATEVKA